MSGNYSIICLLLALAVSACAPDRKSKDGETVTDCVLPSDQAKSLSGKWAITPIPVALQNANWSQGEVQAIAAAAETWNGHFKLVLKSPAIAYSDSGNMKVSADPHPSTAELCGAPITNGAQYSGSVVIYKLGAWPYQEKDVIAITHTCPPANGFSAAMIELNYQNFFIAGKKLPDLQSIVTHELGHMLGLSHSCEAGGTPGMPNCGSSLPESYTSAVMFPTFAIDASGIGEKRRDLNANDEGRVNCLYKPGALAN